MVLNGNGHIGNYCCLHNLVTFADGNYKEIGDRCFIGTGVTFAKNVVIGNDCKISANSFVNKTFNENNLLIGGVPASKICYTDSWIKDYRKRWEQCENLKKEMHLEYL